MVGLGVGAWAALWSTGTAPGHPWAGAFLRGYLLAWLCYLGGAVVVTRAGGLPRWVLVWIVVAAIGLRCICLYRTHRLSTDVWRYLWDGRVAASGRNPFRYPPVAAELGHLRDENWRPINFKEVPTIYPPMAQILFLGLAAMRSSDAEAFRWAFALFDAASVLVLMALLVRTGRPAEHAIWYAWCPLAATEAAAGSHVDAFGLFLLLLALLLAARRQRRPGAGSALALAGAVMTKGYAILTVPFFAARGGKRVLAAFTAGCAVMLAPYLGAGQRLFLGVRSYLIGWKENASLFLVADRLLEQVTSHHVTATRLISAAAMLATVVWLTGKQRPGMEGLLAATFAAFGAQVFLGAPTLPWYAIWLAPALCWWRVPGLALFTLTVSAQYYARWLYPGDEAAHFALLWAGYAPVYALLIGHFLWMRAGRSRRAIAAGERPWRG